MKLVLLFMLVVMMYLRSNYLHVEGAPGNSPSKGKSPSRKNSPSRENSFSMGNSRSRQSSQRNKSSKSRRGKHLFSPEDKAVAATLVMSARTCIASKGRDKFMYSARNLATCCKSCVNSKSGGSIEKALEYWKDPGIVSGDFEGVGCQPYDLQHFEEPENFVESKCKNECDAPDQNYKDKLRRAKQTLKVRNDTSTIAKEIFTFGPVLAGMKADNGLRDNCPKGDDKIYDCTNYNKDLGHAVRILGWGHSGDSGYWLIANSWGCEDKPFIKIKFNSCDIEEHVYAGVPEIRYENV